jgi:hypothetical protein
MKPAFADTSYFLALVNAADLYHVGVDPAAPREV